MSRRPSSKRCFSIPIVKIVVAALKDVGQPEAKLTVHFDEINGELERGAFNISANIDFVGRGPSVLRDDCTLSSGDAIVQW
jgi:hypothetical protein